MICPKLFGGSLREEGEGGVCTNFQISFLYIFSPFQAIQNFSIFMVCPNIFGVSQGGAEKFKNLIFTFYLAILDNLKVLDFNDLS